MNDKKLIKHLGGPAKVATLLGYDKAGGVQRVQNWRARGIPAQVKVDHPEIFMRNWVAKPKTEQVKSPVPHQPERRMLDLEAEPIEGLTLVNRRANPVIAIDKQEH